MYTAKIVKPVFIFRFAWRSVLFSILYASAIVVLYRVFGLRFISIPFVPISIIGIAVAFYVGFKNNPYERWWEARRVWGSITNYSRAFAATSRLTCARFWATQKN